MMRLTYDGTQPYLRAVDTPEHALGVQDTGRLQLL